MRFGLLGPANGDLALLAKGAKLVLFEHNADQVIYLGPDDALDRLVLAWVSELVGGDPSDSGVWARAADRCSAADPIEIAAFVQAESRRERLKALRCLPQASARTIELLEGRVAVMLYDKALLDEEDILPASLLIFGKSKEPLVRQVGSRTFIAPGELGAGPGGVGLVTSRPTGDLEVVLYSPDGTVLQSHSVASAPRTGRFRVLDPGPSGGAT